MRGGRDGGGLAWKSQSVRWVGLASAPDTSPHMMPIHLPAPPAPHQPLLPFILSSCTMFYGTHYFFFLFSLLFFLSSYNLTSLLHLSWCLLLILFIIFTYFVSVVPHGKHYLVSYPLHHFPAFLPFLRYPVLYFLFSILLPTVYTSLVHFSYFPCPFLGHLCPTRHPGNYTLSATRLIFRSGKLCVTSPSGGCCPRLILPRQTPVPAAEKETLIEFLCEITRDVWV